MEDEFLEWPDAEGVKRLLLTHAPRRRPLALNTNWFGEHFSASYWLGLTLEQLSHALLGVSWLAAEKRATGPPFFSPGGGTPFKSEEIKKSTINNSSTVAWIVVDPFPTGEAHPSVNDLFPSFSSIRNLGWERTTVTERVAITKQVLTRVDLFGQRPPAAGWPALDANPAAPRHSQPQRRRRRTEPAPGSKRVQATMRPLSAERSRGQPGVRTRSARTMEAPSSPSPSPPSPSPATPRPGKPLVEKRLLSARSTNPRGPRRQRPLSTQEESDVALTQVGQLTATGTATEGEPITKAALKIQRQDNVITHLGNRLNEAGRAAAETSKKMTTLRAKLVAERARSEDLARQLEEAKRHLAWKDNGDVRNVTRRLVARINSTQEGHRARILDDLYKMLGDDNSRRNRQIFLEVARRHAESENTEGDVCRSEMIALKAAMRARYERYRKKNGGAGVMAYVTSEGKFEMVDIDSDLELKTAAAPTLVALLRDLTTARNWTMVQARGQRCLSADDPYQPKVDGPAMSGDYLSSWLKARGDKKNRRLALLIDLVVHQHDNGGSEVETPVLLMLSLSRHVHGQSHHSICHDSAFGVSVAYGTTRRLLRHISATYIAAFPDLVIKLIDLSVKDEYVAPGIKRRYTVSAVVILKVDNYVKGGKIPRRHLRCENNLILLQTQSYLIDIPRPFGNTLMEPGRRTIPVGPPIDCGRLRDFFRNEQSKMAKCDPTNCGINWKYDLNNRTKLMPDAMVPVLPNTHRLHESTIAPQQPAASSKREHYFKFFLGLWHKLSGGRIFGKEMHVVLVFDTEYILHHAACLEIQREPLVVVRKKQDRGRPRTASTRRKDTMLVDPPELTDDGLLGRLIERNFPAEVISDIGTKSRRKKQVRAIVERVFSKDDEPEVLELLRSQLATGDGERASLDQARTVLDNPRLGTWPLTDRARWVTVAWRRDATAEDNAREIPTLIRLCPSLYTHDNRVPYAWRAYKKPEEEEQ